MEEPVFVKCEPAWPSDTEEQPSNFGGNFHPPLENQAEIKEDPHAVQSLDEVDLNVVKELCPDEDEMGETLDEECDNSGDSSPEVNSSLFSNIYDVMVTISDDPVMKAITTTKTDEVSWNCRCCGKSFKDEGLLRKHMMHNIKHKISTTSCSKEGNCRLLGKDPYQCEKCNKKFSQKKNLNQHMVIHTGEKPYSCSLCSKCFASKANLKSHILTHTGDRSHVCSQCGLAFSRACGLNRHKATHTLSKPFICNICGKAFRHRRSWQKHSVVHSGEKPFLCEKCGGLFSLMGNLKAHKLKIIC